MWLQFKRKLINFSFLSFVVLSTVGKDRARKSDAKFMLVETARLQNRRSCKSQRALSAGFFVRCRRVCVCVFTRMYPKILRISMAMVFVCDQSVLALFLLITNQFLELCNVNNTKTTTNQSGDYVCCCLYPKSVKCCGHDDS